jgi:hypothetical protein
MLRGHSDQQTAPKDFFCPDDVINVAPKKRVHGCPEMFHSARLLIARLS